MPCVAGVAHTACFGAAKCWTWCLRRKPALSWMEKMTLRQSDLFNAIPCWSAYLDENLEIAFSLPPLVSRFSSASQTPTNKD